MRPATSEARDLAHRLLASGTAQKADLDPGTTRAEWTWGMLRAHLGRLVGSAGYRALLSRALALAKAEIPALASASVDADGSLEGVVADEGGSNDRTADVDTVPEAHAAILAHFIGLLVLFIGAGLTARILGDAFPEVMLGNPLAGMETKAQQ